MSKNILTDDEWFDLHEQLSTAFNAYSPNPPARAGLYYGEIASLNPDTIKKAVKLIIRTHDRFPSISQLITVINTLDPPPDPIIEASRRESIEWISIENERRRLLKSIDNLPFDKHCELMAEAESQCLKFRQWDGYNYMLDAAKIMIYRNKYEGKS